jgi:hypothetical protein
MLAYRNVGDIIGKAIQWETALRGFYEVAEVALKNPESRKLVVVLREKLVERLRILQELDVKKYGNAEWVKFVPAVADDEIVPKVSITRSSDPRQVFEVILGVDEKLERFYGSLAGSLVSREQKELFQSLALFKAEQIESIKGYMAQSGS